MKTNIAFKGEYAVSEIVGGLMLVLVAVGSFSVIYPYLFPPGPEYDASVNIFGFISEDGLVVLEHVGGNPIESYRIDILFNNGTYQSTKYTDEWKIGGYRYPLEKFSDFRLTNDSVCLMITVYCINQKGSFDEIFTWTPCGQNSNTQSQENEDPMLISTLRNDTTDEDLICHISSILSNISFILEYPDWDINMYWQIDENDIELVELAYNSTGTPGWIREDVNNDGIVNFLDINIVVSHYGETQITYIYNWTANGDSITDLLLSFDTNSSDTVKDYSGYENDGTLFGPIWYSDGVVGGAYRFDGIDDYISLPYCFNNGYIDEITIETWINTSDDNMVIASYDPDNYWELGLRDGVIRWTTAANGYNTSIKGDTIINDNNWHQIVVIYDSSSGESTINVDGINEKNETCHYQGEELGSGSYPIGYIGTGNIGIYPGVWDLLTYDDFESGFGNYTDGGRDCILYTGGTYAHQGSNAANIQDNNKDESSFYHTNGIDIDTPGYTSLKVDFWFRARDIDYGEDFWIKYYDGSTWHTVADYNHGYEFINGQFYHEIVWINETDYTFPSNMKIKFQCDASSDYDDIYIDQIYINATRGDITIGNFSGMIDEFRIYNRALSEEQIYQNYLCSRDGFSDVSVIVSDETVLGDIWGCWVIPNDSNQDDAGFESNLLQIIIYKGG